jgi:tRNA threonylcarbamoyladenosine biosynthesis protein TsaB
MIVLAIDTSTDAVSVAVNNSKQLLAGAHVTSDRRHAELLAPMIENVCAQADIAMREIDVVAVDIGPGLFTGMRVGIASAKSIAQVLDVPIIGVSSLDILARSVSTTDRVVLSTIDARRGELYWSMYRNDVGPLRYRAQISESLETTGLSIEWASEQLAQPSATVLALIAAELALHEQWQTATELQALYLRQADAEINWQTRVNS